MIASETKALILEVFGPRAIRETRSNSEGSTIALTSRKASEWPYMPNVQVALWDRGYAESLSRLLSDGKRQVHLTEDPQLSMSGVVVLDEATLENLAGGAFDGNRFVVVIRRASPDFAHLWGQGIHHVVFPKDPPNTAQLAVFAAELRLGQVLDK